MKENPIHSIPFDSAEDINELVATFLAALPLFSWLGWLTAGVAMALAWRE